VREKRARRDGAGVTGDDEMVKLRDQRLWGCKGSWRTAIFVTVSALHRNSQALKAGHQQASGERWGFRSVAWSHGRIHDRKFNSLALAERQRPLGAGKE
jgi:hypothetical protein